MPDLFGNDDLRESAPVGRTGKLKKGVNPLVAIYGPCLDTSQRCGDCAHHFFRSYSKNYPKSAIRSEKAKHDGASTDHSSRYKACAKFERKKELNPKK